MYSIEKENKFYGLTMPPSFLLCPLTIITHVESFTKITRVATVPMSINNLVTILELCI